MRFSDHIKIKSVLMMCALLLFLSGCGADVDMILQNDSAEESEDALQDGISEYVSEAEVEESAGLEAASGDADDRRPICVYICGAVECPGVYELPEGSRIWEAVEMAGGMTADADDRSVNLAQAMADGDMIFVPTQEESAAGVSGTVSSGSSGSGSGTASSDSGGKVNINTAGVEELTTLNGIGEAKAEAIVAYRDEHGFFKSTDEIMEVSGIGEGTYDKIKDYIAV